MRHTLRFIRSWTLNAIASAWPTEPPTAIIDACEHWCLPQHRDEPVSDETLVLMGIAIVVVVGIISQLV